MSQQACSTASVIGSFRCPAPIVDSEPATLGPTLAQDAAQLFTRGFCEAARLFPTALPLKEHLNTASN